MTSFPGEVSETQDLLRDDPGLLSGLLICEVLAWHVADATDTSESA
jgi:hypothetical protein